MKAIQEVFNELITNLHLIFRLAVYEIKGKYQLHYLGAAWQFLSPALQIFIYWFVFGVGIRSGHPVDGTPYFVWLLMGMIPWFFISPTIIQGSNSVFTKINLVSKMKFPVSVLPSVTIISNSFTFFVMLFILFGLLFLYGINPGIYLIQLPYYLICLYFFLYSLTLLFSTISVMIRDFQMVLQSFIRMMLYLTPILWDMSRLPDNLVSILKLNPIFYIIEGFRNTFLAREWFFDDMIYASYFWIATSLILFLGSLIHLKFRKQFVDFI
jgi:teichoic acid transport system permease protein